METKIIIGIVAIVSMLAGGFGGTMLFTQDQLDNMYVCSLTDEVGIFDRLSASMKTGYWMDDLGVEQKKACRDGRIYDPWVPLEQYAEDHNVSINDLLEPKIVNDIQIIYESSNAGIQWECSPKSCIKIK